MELVDFINARLDEDERIAKDVTAEDWGTDDTAEWSRHEWEDLPDAAFAHARRRDPERVLADVAAKRTLVKFWSHAYRWHSDFPGLEWDRVRGNAQWTLKKLALPYADHPDYNPGWRP